MASVTVILAAGSGARLIVRTVGAGSESGRELPGGPDVVLLDEQVFSLYAAVADLATPAGRTLTAVFPAHRQARHLHCSPGIGRQWRSEPRRRSPASIAGTLLTDALGRVQRLELPSQGLMVAQGGLAPLP